MTQTQRRRLERIAARYLQTGKVEQSVATYRQLGQPSVYERKLRDQAEDSLRQGDAPTAIAAYIAAGCLRHTNRSR